MSTVLHAAISDDLKAMASTDQEMCTIARNYPEAWDAAVDQRHTARMQKIMAEIGWPSIPKVGAEASTAAWLLVQHARRIVPL